MRGFDEVGEHVLCPSTVANPKETAPDDAHAPWEQKQPDRKDQESSTPGDQHSEHVQGSTTDEDGGRDGVGHSRVVQLGEAKGGFAELAVLLLGVRQPFHEALLVDIFDAAAALAWVEERLIQSAFAAAYSAGVGLVLVMVMRVGCMGDDVGRLARAIVGVVGQPHVWQGGITRHGRAANWGWRVGRRAGITGGEGGGEDSGSGGGSGEVGSVG